MKKNKLFFLAIMLAVVCIGFTSCEDDEDSAIVGTWKCIGWEEYTDNGGRVFHEDESVIGYGNYIQFKANSKGFIYRLEEGVWDKSSFEYKYYPNSYLVDMGEITLPIYSITETELKLRIPYSPMDNYVYRKVNDSVLNNLK